MGLFSFDKTRTDFRVFVEIGIVWVYNLITLSEQKEGANGVRSLKSIPQSLCVLDKNELVGCSKRPELVCSVCLKEILEQSAYSDTYHYPLCLECLLDLHRI